METINKKPEELKTKEYKGLVFVGPSLSGKSKIASLIIDQYKPEETNRIQGRSLIDAVFPFQGVTTESKLLVIEDVESCSYLGYFYSLLTGHVTIHRLGYIPFEHRFEQIIIVLDSAVKLDSFLQASFQRRVKIIQFPIIN